MQRAKWLLFGLLACTPQLPSSLEAEAHDIVRVLRPVTVDLRADTNRSGVIELDDPTEDEGEDAFTESRGAVFLANIDDDTGRCRMAAASSNDRLIANCNDATDEVVNGDDDRADLAPLVIKPFEDATNDTTGTLDIAAPAVSNIRLFKEGPDRALVVAKLPIQLTPDELRLGQRYFIEGRDLLRDTTLWDGLLQATLTVVVPNQDVVVPGTYTDVVKMKLAPVMTYHHLLPAKDVYVSRTAGRSSTEFVAALTAHLTAGAPQMTLVSPSVQDPWIQDFFEVGYTSMPGAGGTQHVINVYFRSANIEEPSNTNNPLRAAGRLVFTQFQGRDKAGVQQVDYRSALNAQSLNSFGNYETIPPYTLNGVSYPLGRQLRGAIPSFKPDSSFTKMMDAQRMQPVIEIDTSWLVVGHVDETMSFLKASTPRGWVMLVNDARMARKMLQDASAAGHGSELMFRGKYWLEEDARGNVYQVAAQKTVDQVLADTDVAASSNESAVKVDQQLAIIRRETGLTDDELVPVPFLHHDMYGDSVAYQPGTVNMLVLDERNVVVPDPFGPIINGKDIFKVQLEESLAKYQVKIWWIDDWDLYHRNLGEVHCGTNALRATPETKWWEVKP